MIDFMKKQVGVTLAMLALVLTSCSGQMPGLGLIGLDGRPQQDDSGGFYENLASEYANLAAYEQDFMGHDDDAAYFAAKARRALREQDVAPDRPDRRDIPPFAMRELTDARAMLMNALKTLNTAENAALLAMAQTRYDCWLSHQEDLPQEGVVLACKEGFYSALALLTPPETEGSVYSIYFDPASTELDVQATATVEQIAQAYHDKEGWDVIVKGYSDKKGGKSENQVLSMRRAIAVKHMLGQHGVDMNYVAISAEGAIAGADERESRRVDVEIRPPNVAQDKRGLSAIPSWRHSGEF